MSQTYTCTACGEPISAEATMCHHCGAAGPAVAAAGDETYRKTHFRLQPRVLAAGDVLVGRFALVRPIGQGGMGMVWLAEDRTLHDEALAIKVLHADLASDTRGVRSLQQEVSMARRLTHTNIVRIHEYHTDDEVDFITMEFVEGQSLADKVGDAHEGLPLADVLTWAAQAADALDHAHNEGILHRDIKPGNFLLSNTEVLKLADFGIARAAEDSKSRLTGRVSSGTLLYMSPEQALGRTLDRRADVYSFAASLYELLAGQPPFHTGDISLQVQSVTPEPIAGLPPHVNDALLKSLGKKPEERHESAGALVAAMREPVRPAAATPTPSPGKEEKETPPSPGAVPETASSGAEDSARRRVLGIVLLIGLAVVIAGAVYWTSPGSQDEGDTAPVTFTDILKMHPEESPQEQGDLAPVEIRNVLEMPAGTPTIARDWEAFEEADRFGMQNEWVEEHGPARAAAWKAAADGGDANATILYAAALERGAGVEEDDEAARALYEPLAEAGHVRAMTRLGDLLYVYDSEKNSELVTPWYRKAADRGDARGKLWLGSMYALDAVQSQDKQEAERLLRKAEDLHLQLVKGGHPDAMYRLAGYVSYAIADDQKSNRELMGYTVDELQARALELIQKAASFGHPHALYNMGSMYIKGQSGLAPDPRAAAASFRRAAEGGSKSAMNDMAALYAIGLGVPEGDAEALRWIHETGHFTEAEAMMQLGEYLQRRSSWWGESHKQALLAAAVKWLTRAVERGNVDAAHALATSYHLGYYFEQDFAEATRWYKKAADMGHVPSMDILGGWYENGTRVDQDYAEARRWYKMAASKGDVGAMFALGLMYGHGKGVEKDLVEGYRWYRNAADQGHSRAMYFVGQGYDEGVGGLQVDQARAFEWYKKAADAGDRDAMYAVGLIYGHGKGVDHDLAEAFRWYRNAADNGHVRAMYFMGDGYENGKGGLEVDRAEAIAWYSKAADGGDEDAKKRLEALT